MFVFQVLKGDPSDLTKSPEDGCYIRGLFVEGARWDSDLASLAESIPKTLYTDMPALWLIPTPNRKPPESGIYECPVYKTLTRAGMCWDVLQPSVNYILLME
jgi:dynein heavy chain